MSVVVVRLPQDHSISANSLRARLHKVSYRELLAGVELLQHALQPLVDASSRQEASVESDTSMLPLVGIHMSISGDSIVDTSNISVSKRRCLPNS